jgi:hypothetical protein
MRSWAATELGSACLGDARRTSRLIALVDTLATHPCLSIPQACHGDRAAIKAAYRFFASAEVRPAAIIAAHRDATGARCAPYPVVLALQDTTELNFTHHPATTGLGPLRAAKQQGFLVHSVLAASPDGVPLGLLDQQQWARHPAGGRAKTRRNRETQDKESQRWLDAEAATLAALPPEVTVLSIADREADIYDLFAAPRRHDAHLLIRAAHTRRVEDTPAGEAAYSWDVVQQQPAVGQLTVTIQPTTKRTGREATLVVRHCALTLQPPRHHKKRAQCRPVPVHAILAIEVAPPAGEPPVIWRLLTTWPVETDADVLGLIQAYSFRWLIERYHFVLKSGCRIEELQLETQARLERAVATYSVVAVRVLRLTYLARREPDAPGLPELREAEWPVLAAAVPALLPADGSAPTVRAVVRAIATLGGFMGRKGDGEPGVKTLWQGLHQLTLMAHGWELHQALSSRSPPLTSCG